MPAQALRTLELRKSPSVSETLDWTRALVLLGAQGLDAALVRETLATVVKHREDAERALDKAAQVLQAGRA